MAKAEPKDPTYYLSGPDTNGLWSVIYRALPLSAPGSLDQCAAVARQYRLSWPMTRWTGQRFVAPEESPK